jgi:hypothetical protein
MAGLAAFSDSFLNSEPVPSKRRYLVPRTSGYTAREEHPRGCSPALDLLGKSCGASVADASRWAANNQSPGEKT